MFGSIVLDVGIGLVLVYIVFALACTTINEQISQFLGLRANNLWDSICALVGDLEGNGVAKQLYDHQLVRGLASKQGGYEDKANAEHPADRPMPSYIPPDVFSLALNEIIKAGKSGQEGKDSHQTKANETIREGLEKALGQIYLEAAGDVEKARKGIEAWYQEAMDRATGWYKRKVQLIIFLVAMILVTAANADSIMITNKLWNTPAMRTAAVTKAEGLKEDEMGNLTVQNTPEVSGLLGWTACEEDTECLPASVSSNRPTDVGSWIMKIFGLLITAYAASLGAPFWFEILQKLTKAKDSLSGKDKKATDARVGGQA